jgi:hypothetical protein
MIGEHPTVTVARHLREITDELWPRLLEQAEHQARSRLMPGGEAMVALGNVANVEAWENMHQATERYGRAYTSVADEDPDQAWSAYQLLEFWSEAWRAERGAEYDASEYRTTVATEAAFLRSCLDWAWDNEPHWDDFATDVATARRKLEDILLDGIRSERGAPCLYEKCKGKRLVRRLQPRSKDGYKVWVHSNWHCPSCHREWDDDGYARMVTAANEAAKVEIIDGEEWVSTDLAARRVDRPASTIRVWVHRAEIAVACVLSGRRGGFVKMAEVEERHAQAKRRKRAA